MTGMSFINASFKDIIIDNCNCKYINFAAAKLSKVLIKDSNLSETSFMETDIKDLEHLLKIIDDYESKKH